MTTIYKAPTDQNTSATDHSDQSKTNEAVRSKPIRDPNLYQVLSRFANHSAKSLSAFIVEPKAFHFDTQDKEEKVLLILRRHIFTNIRWISIGFLMLFFPLILSFVPIFNDLPLRYQTLITLGWYLLVLGYMFEQFLLWYFNVFIITDERVLDYDFHSLLYKRVSKAKIDKIEDVTYEMHGVIQSFLNYGSVYIQTAAEQREFEFIDVPQPDLVAKLLNEIMIEEEQEKIEGRVR